MTLSIALATIPSLPFTATLSQACQALPTFSAGPHVRVLWREFMPTFTPVRAIRYCRGGHASQDVLSMRNRVHMSGVDACRDTAQMVKLKPIGYLPDLTLIDHSMRQWSANSAVPIGIDSALPNPTRRLIASVFFKVLNRRRASVVPADVATRMTYDRSCPSIGLLGYRRGLSASTHAKTGRVGWSNAVWITTSHLCTGLRAKSLSILLRAPWLKGLAAMFAITQRESRMVVHQVLLTLGAMPADVVSIAPAFTCPNYSINPYNHAENDIDETVIGQAIAAGLVEQEE